MRASGWERVVPLAGVAFVVLSVVGFALIGEVGRTSTPSPEQINDLLSDRPTLRVIGSYLSLLAVPFLVLFAASIYRTLRRGVGDEAWLPALSLAGGVVAGAALLVAFAVILQASIRADSAEGLGPDAAVVFYDVYRIVLSASGLGFAILVGAAAMESYRTQSFPRWLSWLSGGVALGLISPLFFFFVFIAFIWVLVVSVWMFRAALRG